MSEALGFKNPQEEITHIQQEVLKREAILRGSGAEVNREQIISEKIHEYKNSQNVLHPSYETSQEAIAALALNLSPETHDRRMSELLVLLNTKGIRNTLKIIEKLSETHIEDDFHRFLVQYIKKGFDVKGLNRKEPLSKALNMTLYEVILPAGEDEEKRTLKEIISSMEQFYAGMLSVSSEKNPRENYITIEIANSFGSDEFVFYASVPNHKRDLFEKQVLSVFYDAKIVEKNDDHNIFNPEGVALGAIATSGNNAVFPLKTYEQFDYDPLNIILNSFSKLKKEGEGACLQVMISPVGDMYLKKYSRILEEIEKGKKVKDVLKEKGFLAEVVGFLSEGFGSSKEKKDKEPERIDTVALDKIKKKIATPIVAASLRLVVSAPTLGRCEEIISDMESAFNQFSDPQGNSLKFKKVKGGKIKYFLRSFAFRAYDWKEVIPLNLSELTTIMHFHTTAVKGVAQLKTTKAGDAPAPINLPQSGTLLGENSYRSQQTKVFITDEDRMRHFYTIGQTGTGKTTFLKNMIIQDIERGNGVCFIDPHGSDVQDVLAHVPQNRLNDVIYFDPAYTARPMALNMLEYDSRFPEQKTFVVNELFSIFQKLYGAVPESMGPMFEQYFRNATMLVIEDPESGSTLLDVSRVMSNKEFRQFKLSRCKNPVIVQFWTEVAEKAGGEAALANIVPYITSKFDVFLANEIMRPIVAQEHSAFNFREIMDGKKILLVNLSKGRLGDINANLIGLILVGKILMAALSRVDSLGTDLPPFYLYLDEFQNITTPSIATILSEARKYKLSLFIAHQFIAQLDENIKNAVFGNVGSMAVFRVGAEDAEYLVKQFEPIFSARDIMNIDNFNAYIKMLVNGKPEKPFNIRCSPPPAPTNTDVSTVKELSYLKYGKNREEVESEILKKYQKAPIPDMKTAPSRL
ncbi:MAG TPA: TraM recognition domain-containing protein [Candidatus Paceibacterota bacterium]